MNKINIVSPDTSLSNKFKRLLMTETLIDSDFILTEEPIDTGVLVYSTIYHKLIGVKDINKYEGYSSLLIELINLINQFSGDELIITLPIMELNVDELVRSKIIGDIKMKCIGITKVRLDFSRPSETLTTHFLFGEKKVTLITVDESKLI